MEIFAANKLRWPPSREDLPAEHKYGHLGQGAFERVYYCNAVFPYNLKPDASGKYPCQYMDANEDSVRSCGPNGTRSPWSQHLPTFTEGTQVIVRKANLIEIQGGVTDLAISIFQLDGLELMQLMGWDISYFRGQYPGHKCAKNMAGNAFSAFTIAMVDMAVYSALGINEDDD